MSSGYEGPAINICIFGGGAIGGYLAVNLGQVVGAQVSVVARGTHLEAIQREGLRLVSPAGERRVRVTATDRAEDLGRLGVSEHHATEARCQVNANENTTNKVATVSAEERRAIRARMLIINMLGLALAAIAFLVWRVNELTHAIGQLPTGK